MKNQDIGLLLKLICLHKQEEWLYHQFDVGHWDEGPYHQFNQEHWQDWELIDNGYDSKSLEERHLQKSPDDYIIERYSVRALAKETGISKSQVSLALQRNYDIGLARRDRKLGIPRVNTKALFEFIIYAVRYVFPARPGAVTRGIATSLGAPVLEGQLMSTGDLIPVWPDARGNTKGQAVEPLFKSATYAVRRDAELYALLALVDAIRIGQPRERNMGIELLQKRLEITK